MLGSTALLRRMVKQGVRVFQEGKERVYRLVIKHSADQHPQARGITKLRLVNHQGEVGIPFTPKELEGPVWE